MIRHSRPLTLFAVIAAGILPVAAAQAQSYGQPAPLYPYAVQQNQPYAVQVAPNTYVIKRPAPTRDYPYVRCVNCSNRASHAAAAPAPGRFDHPHKSVDHALVEELRKRSRNKMKEKEEKEQETDINTTKVVRDPPVVVEHKRYVDDPPRVIERKIIVDEPARSKCKRGIVESCDTGSRASGEGKKRVIEADAEVTILGSDRMSIRLFRKGHGPSAKTTDDK
jgi:hypothetical protein